MTNWKTFILPIKMNKCGLELQNSTELLHSSANPGSKRRLSWGAWQANRNLRQAQLWPLWPTWSPQLKCNAIGEKMGSWIGILVGGLEHEFYFSYLGNSHPNWLIFFRGVETTNQYMNGNESSNHNGDMGTNKTNLVKNERWLCLKWIRPPVAIGKKMAAGSSKSSDRCSIPRWQVRTDYNRFKCDVLLLEEDWKVKWSSFCFREKHGKMMGCDITVQLVLIHVYIYIYYTYI